ncbi:hypothetical protein BD410DRAFT_787700 [Rickenella mellea]|uniref:Uncharacterized protein n=1 Tax=Rickenella mellea TaxID=50990 RepID=A0A4Y7Q7S5_9AGAM|nr:hypothetical protein BD410DRAFT_787700 [Rickenella mellea]
MQVSRAERRTVAGQFMSLTVTGKIAGAFATPTRAACAVRHTASSLVVSCSRRSSPGSASSNISAAPLSNLSLMSVETEIIWRCGCAALCNGIATLCDVARQASLAPRLAHACA